MTVSHPKYLVVDDEIIREKDKKLFIKPLPVEAGIFVKSYEEALEVLELNSRIILAFLDVRIPFNSRDKYTKEDKDSRTWIEDARKKVQLENEYGIQLLREISNRQIKNIIVYIYSAYEERIILERVTERYKNIVKHCFEKSNRSDDIQREIQSYVPIFDPQASISTSLKSFDYSSLDEDISSFVQSRAKEIKRLTRRATEDLMDIGHYLIEVKEKLGYGNFYNWLEAEFEWSPSTAVRIIKVAEKFSSVSLEGLNILPSALYVLASPSTPEEAIAEVMERAKQGETIAEKSAKAIKTKHKKLKEKAETTNQAQRIERTVAKKADNKVRQEILGVLPSRTATPNSWWQLGEHNRLFCGEPKSQEFLGRLPRESDLVINFLPKNDPSLIPPIESNSTLTFHSKYEDLDLDSLIEDYISTATRAKDIVVFNYLYYVGILNLTESLNCYFWVAEPDLKKCERILTIWREKGSVMRIA